MNFNYIAVALILQYILLALIYGYVGDWRHVIYWLCVIGITWVVTW